MVDEMEFPRIITLPIEVCIFFIFFYEPNTNRNMIKIKKEKLFILLKAKKIFKLFIKIYL